VSRKGAVLAFAASVAVLAALGAVLFRGGPQAPSSPIVVYCAVAVRPPVEAAAKAFEQETGVPVRLQLGASQTLLANARVGGEGDLYVPADDSYIAMARDQKLVDESIPLASMVAVLAVRKGNPKGVRSLDDLAREGVKLVQAEPDATAVGKLTREALVKAGAWDRVKARTVAFKPTVNDVANDIKLGSADAGFVWDATVHAYPDLERIDLPVLAGVKGAVGAAVLRSSKRPTAALRFARWLSAPEKGGEEFRKAGFEPAGGDPWSLAPELRLFSGAMLQPAIEKTLKDFEAREGARVTTIYNGCGILVGQMKTGERPDLYFSCDEQFMKQVKDHFGPARNVSINQLVILVPKANPHGVRKLKDLGKPGLRLGVGHEQQCALGALTKETLIQDGTYKDLRKNVVVELPTGDMLVNQIKTGALDAVVAYVSNAVGAGDVLQAFPVEVPCAMAVQPVAIGKTSRYPRLAERLLESFFTERSKERFLAEGFRWKADP
jgi:molybdenum ABC transporter molybdate-binding protein